MPIRAYREVFTACFKLNSILYQRLVGRSDKKRETTGLAHSSPRPPKKNKRII